MRLLEDIIFGDVRFRESEEYDEFTFRCLIIILLSGALFTALFLIGEYSNLNRISGCTWPP